MYDQLIMFCISQLCLMNCWWFQLIQWFSCSLFSCVYIEDLISPEKVIPALDIEKEDSGEFRDRKEDSILRQGTAASSTIY